MSSSVPCLSIYVIERCLRIYRAHLPVTVLSVCVMDDVLQLEFAKEGSIFEHENYKEGQVRLQAGRCSSRSSDGLR